MATPQDRIDIFEITIEEMKRVCDWLDAAYNRMKTKTLTFLGGGLATMTFLYAEGKLFIPSQTYGKIFYFTGLALLILSLATLFRALLPHHWEFSIEDKDVEAIKFPNKKDFLASKETYLEYVKDRYMTAYKMNLVTYNANHSQLNRAFYPLVLGAIILTVLRIFGT